MLQLQQYILFSCVIIRPYFKKRSRENMKIIKRDGHVVDYSPDKIKLAIQKANNEMTNDEDKVSDIQIKNIVKYIESLQKK